MKITKKQSLFIASGSIAAFFAIGVLFLKTNRHSVQFASVQSSATQSSSAPRTTSSQASASSSSEVDDIAAAESGSGFFTLDGFHRTQVDEGRKLWEINGNEAKYSPASNATVIKDMHMVLTSRAGKNTDLTAKDATVYLNGPVLSKAHLKHDVVVLYNDDYTMTADEMFTDQIAHTLTVPGVIKIKGTTLDLQADKLDGKLDTEEFTFSGNVVTVMKSDPRKGAGKK